MLVTQENSPFAIKHKTEFDASNLVLLTQDRFPFHSDIQHKAITLKEMKEAYWILFFNEKILNR
jgi:hypothetical protein